ncbi:hypothetical protein [Saccharothrix sp. HUAS TT1]|uniref:hypothetical protein n=1 Tax=unclassified Saccharothrix TaxID=2593673 RepID=UPI00345C0515
MLVSLDQAAQLGLIVFMFLLGCELRTDRVVSWKVVGGAVLGFAGATQLIGLRHGLISRDERLAGVRPPAAIGSSTVDDQLPVDRSCGVRPLFARARPSAG